MKKILIVISAFFSLWPTMVLGTTLDVISTEGNGIVGFNTGATWSDARDAANGNTTNVNPDPYEYILLSSLDTGNYYNWRAFFAFDTASLPDDAVITSASLFLKATGSPTNQDSASAYVVPSSQASVSTLANSDYTEYSTSPISAAKAIGDFNIDSYTEIPLTDTSTINVSGYSKMAVISDLDLDNTTPLGRNQILVYFSAADVGNQPYLHIEYTSAAPSAGGTTFWNSTSFNEFYIKYRTSMLFMTATILTSGLILGMILILVETNRTNRRNFR